MPQTEERPVGTVGSDAFLHVYGEAICEVSPAAKGTRDVFLVFRGTADTPVGEFEYFRFEQYRGQTPLQTNEVKLEIRVGSKEGEKLGEYYPRFTGGADMFPARQSRRWNPPGSRVHRRSISSYGRPRASP